MCVVAAVAGAGLGGAVISSMGAQSAADTQAAAANQATAAQQQAAQQSIAAQQQAQQQAQANAQPWINAGSSALGQLGALLGIAIPGTPAYSAAATGGGGTMTGGPTGGFAGTPAGTQASVLQALQNTPGYQFSLQQGLQGVENSAAARGMGLSGATLKALNDYAQGTAQQTYGQNIGYLESLAGLGQSSSGQAGAGALQTGANIGGTLTGLGGQIGSNLIGAGNVRAAGQVAGSNALGGALGGVGQMYAMNQLFGGGGGGYTPAVTTPVQDFGAGVVGTPLM